jgi:orotate phosphoribosyltransferase
MPVLPVHYQESRLIELVRAHALVFGEFRLASGATANFYLDCRKLTLQSEGANQIAAGIWSRIERDLPDAIGGMAVGAVPIVASVLSLAGWRGVCLAGFFVRKEAKQHGTGKSLEGPVQPGQRAVIVEDVITSGGSCLAAIAAAREFGLVVDRAIAVIDRRPGNHPEFAAAGVDVESLLTIDQLGLS